MTAAHTPEPWRWELNEATRTLHLVGGKPQFDLTIIEPVRWGMGSATLMIRDTAFDGMNIMHKLHERRDWIKAFPGRDHHVRWCTGVSHPDMLLIEAAPQFLEASLSIVECLGNLPQFLRDENNFATASVVEEELAKHRAAIAKATGAAA